MEQCSDLVDDFDRLHGSQRQPQADGGPARKRKRKRSYPSPSSKPLKMASSDLAVSNLASTHSVVQSLPEQAQHISDDTAGCTHEQRKRLRERTEYIHKDPEGCLSCFRHTPWSDVDGAGPCRGDRDARFGLSMPNCVRSTPVSLLSGMAQPGEGVVSYCFKNTLCFGDLGADGSIHTLATDGVTQPRFEAPCGFVRMVQRRVLGKVVAVSSGNAQRHHPHRLVHYKGLQFDRLRAAPQRASRRH